MTELGTLNKLIKDQGACVQDMLAHYGKFSDKQGQNGVKFLNDVASFLLDHKSQIKSMIQSAQAAKQAYR